MVCFILLCSLVPLFVRVVAVTENSVCTHIIFCSETLTKYPTAPTFSFIPMVCVAIQM